MPDLVNDLAAIEQFPGSRITKLMYLVWSTRPDLQSAFDLSTPEGQTGFQQWAGEGIKREYGIDASEPTPSNQADEPSASRNWVSRSTDWIDALLGRSTRQSSAAPVPGATLIGYTHGVLGMGEHVRMTAAALTESRVPFGIFDVDPGPANKLAQRAEQFAMVDRNRHRANVFHVNADQMLATYCALGSDFFNSRYNIGYWAWELSKWPADWVPTLDMVDEIWAPSRFIRDCLKTVTDKPVVHMPLCVELPHFGRRSRSHFGLPEGDCLFLYTFDFHSYIDRKNPLAAVRAFKRAFPSGKEKAGLVLKIMKGDPESPKWQEMIEAIDHDPRIYVINQMMSRADVLALLDSCDCFLSLHRSEGFGRGPAEAMYLGKAVIATNYSGNVDFTRPGASLLVDYQLVPVKPGEYVCGEGQVWADPDVDHAARQMLLVQQGSAEVQEIAARGQEVILKEFSNAAVGRNMRKRLTEIGALPTWIGRQFHRWGQRKPAPARPHWPKAEHRRKNKPRPSRQS